MSYSGSLPPYDVHKVRKQRCSGRKPTPQYHSTRFAISFDQCDAWPYSSSLLDFSTTIKVFTTIAYTISSDITNMLATSGSPTCTHGPARSVSHPTVYFYSKPSTRSITHITPPSKTSFTSESTSTSDPYHGRPTRHWPYSAFVSCSICCSRGCFSCASNGYRSCAYMAVQEKKQGSK
jgi:hypothetical protein